MKYIKKYNEKFTIEPAVDWIKDTLFRKETEEDIIAKSIISKIIPNLDPEDITKIAPENNFFGHNTYYEFHINRSSICRVEKNERTFSNGEHVSNVVYVNIDEDILNCSNEIKKKLYNLIKNMYDKEQHRLKIQKISTNTGL